MVSWILLVTFLLLAVLRGPWWWWGPTAMMAAVCGRLYYRHSRPWWRVHCTMIRIYIDTSAHESTVAQQQGREFNVKNAIRSMMRRAHPEWDDSQAEEFIFAATQSMPGTGVHRLGRQAGASERA